VEIISVFLLFILQHRRRPERRTLTTGIHTRVYLSLLAKLMLQRSRSNAWLDKVWSRDIFWSI